jgi:hypothetical protein
MIERTVLSRASTFFFVFAGAENVMVTTGTVNRAEGTEKGNVGK